MRRAARMLMPLGICVVVLAVGDYHRTHRGPYAPSWWTVAYIGVLIVAAYGAGLPDLTRAARFSVAASVTAAGGAAVGVSVAQLVAGSQLLPRFVVLASAVALVPWYLCCSVVANGGRKQERLHARLLLVASADDAAALRSELHRSPEHDAYLSGVLSHEEATATDPWTEPLFDAAIRMDASILVLDRRATAEPSIVQQAATLHQSGVRVRTLARFYEEWLGKMPTSELERISLMFDIGEIHRARYSRMRRIADVVVGLIGCAVLVPAMAFVWTLNRFGNPGPLLYRQDRVGRNRRVFTILKFRSMRPHGGGGSTWTESDDPRIPRVGKFLRRTHLDELPQMWNILRGDLSLVGPRPEQPQYVDELEDKLPWYHVRHLVRPGLTGWAQVKCGYAASAEDALEKLQYELYYLRYQGPALDLRIISRTLRHVAGLGGR